MPRKKIRKATDSQAFRILKMLDQLSSKNTFTKEELSLKYGKSVRTIERDIEDVNQFKPGMVVIRNDGQVAIGPGFTMVQPELNAAQQVSLIELYFVAQKLGVRMHNDFELLFKALTGDNPWEYADEIVPAMPKITNSPSLEHEVLEKLKTAVDQHYIVDITYQTEKAPFPVNYLKPLGLLISDGNVYLQTLKGAKNIRRQYRLDRIQSCELTGERFSAPADIAELILNSRSIWGVLSPEERTIPLKIKIEGVAREYFQTHELIPGQEIAEMKDGTLSLTAKIGHYMEILPHILRWMPDVQVIAPIELREEVRNKARAFLKK